MTETATWTDVAAAYAENGAVDDALLLAATAAGVGVVQVSADGAVEWSDEAYRLHGRPRWRRVRRIDDVEWALSAEDGALVRSAYWVLTSDPDVEVRYVVRPETGPARELVLHALGDGVAVVHRGGRSLPAPRPGVVVDVRDQPAAATAEPPVAEWVRDDVASDPETAVAAALPEPIPTVAPTPAPTPAPEQVEPAAPVDEKHEPAPTTDAPLHEVPAQLDVASAVLSASPDLVVVCDLDTHRVVMVAGSSAQGPDLIAGLGLGSSLTDLAVHADDLNSVADWRDNLTTLEADEVRHTEARFLIDGRWQWRELRATEFVRDDDDVLREAVIVIRDVDERMEAGLRLAERERAFREVFDASPVGLAVLDEQGRFSAVNDAFCRLVGRTREDVFATVYEALLHHEDRAAAVLSRAKKISEGGLATATERRLVRSDGTVIWVRMRTSEIDYDLEARTLVSVEDVTSSKANEDRLRHDAMHDQLTGLPNRRLIVDRIDRALSRARRGGTHLALFFIDIDDLKRVNDTHPWNHRAGDVLITSVAVAIRDSLRDTDTLGRLGGDEFVAICEDVGDDATINDLGARILSAVRQPLVIGSESVTVSASVGVAIPDNDDESAEQLLGRADSAMYQAKVSGGARVVRADGERVVAGANADLVLALARDELRLNYQPIVSLATGAVLGVEAVVRWTRPSTGVVPAAEVRAALDSGASALPVVHWSLTRAVDDLRTVSPSRAEHLSVWLSLPARAALASSTRAAVEAALNGHDGMQNASTAPTLVLGLHEHDVATLMRRSSLMRHLTELVAVGPLGVGVVDFTADVVPVGLLRQLETVSVTLDPELLASAAEDSSVESLVRSLVGAASALRVVTIAAGIESQEHLDLARRLGVDAVQGDLVGPFAPLEVYSDLLLRGTAPLPNTEAAAPPSRLEPSQPVTSGPTESSPTASGPTASSPFAPISAAPSPFAPSPFSYPVAPEPVVPQSGASAPAPPAAGPVPDAVAPSIAPPRPRLLLGEIGDSLARELGVTLPPLGIDPGTTFDVDDSPLGAELAAQAKAGTGPFDDFVPIRRSSAPIPTAPAPAPAPAVAPAPDPAAPATARTGAFSGYDLPPSPYLVLRPTTPE